MKRPSNKLKKTWAENLELLIPDMQGIFTLETDASDKKLGAVLWQNRTAIAYISRTLIKQKKTTASLIEKYLPDFGQWKS